MKNMATGFALTAFFLFLGLFYLFTDRYLRNQFNPNQSVQSVQGGEILLHAARDGHYRVGGTINGELVIFLLDTGATQVSVGQALAERLELSRGQSVSVFTANGKVTGYQTTIDLLEFAGYRFEKVPALIMPRMDNEILLGMSILQQFHWQRERQEWRLIPLEK